jgi:hypothetical protein
MAYRKIYIAIDCASEAEAVAVQEFGKEVSALFQMKAADVLRIAPAVKKNSGLLRFAAKTIATEGTRGLAKVIPYFMANVKK